MDILELREYCLSLLNSEEAMPFGDDTLVFKVAGKMYALTSITSGNWVNLKCDPGKAIELREKYEDIIPGYHMNKTHWNTVKLNGDLPDAFIKEMILDSLRLIIASLPRTKQTKFENI